MTCQNFKLGLGGDAMSPTSRTHSLLLHFSADLLFAQLQKEEGQVSPSSHQQFDDVTTLFLK